MFITIAFHSVVTWCEMTFTIPEYTGMYKHLQSYGNKHDYKNKLPKKQTKTNVKKMKSTNLTICDLWWMWNKIDKGKPEY